jgi:hypothetical protein
VRFFERVLTVTGPAVVPAVAAAALAGETEEFLTVALAAAAGVARAAILWGREGYDLAVGALVLPIAHKLVKKPDGEVADTFHDFVAVCAGDNDFRRLQWLVDLTVELLGDPAQLRKGIIAAGQLYDQSHPRFHPQIEAIFADHVLGGLSPLSALSIPVLQEVAKSLSGALVKGLGRGFEIAGPRLLFERVFDAELGKSDEHLAILLRAVPLGIAMGHERFLPLVADRIAQIFSLHTTVVRYEDVIVQFLRALPKLHWWLVPEKFDKVLTDLAGLFPTTTWPVQRLILGFVHRVSFAGMFRISPAVFRKIFDTFVPIFAANGRSEIREGGVAFARMLILLAFKSFEEFWKDGVESKSGKVAVANGVALLGAVSVINGVPQWLPQLLELLVTLHKKELLYAKIIEAEFADFWTRVGPQEIEEIDDFRFAFGASYCT